MDNTKGFSGEDEFFDEFDPFEEENGFKDEEDMGKALSEISVLLSKLVNYIIDNEKIEKTEEERKAYAEEMKCTALVLANVNDRLGRVMEKMGIEEGMDPENGWVK